MPFFTTPAVREKWGRHRLFSRIGLDRGVTVLKNDGAYTQVSDPDPEDITAADAAYIGGRIYEISEDEADDLTEAGYGDYIS